MPGQLVRQHAAALGLQLSLLAAPGALAQCEDAITASTYPTPTAHCEALIPDYPCADVFCAECTALSMNGLCDLSCGFCDASQARSADAGPVVRADCADVVDCEAYVASGQYSCEDQFCPSCGFSGFCDSLCGFCILPPSDSHAIADVLEHAVDGVAGFTTYRLYVNLPSSARNVYSISGTAEYPMQMPAAYQHSAGANVGGVDPAVLAANAGAEFDSWLTIGPAEGSTDISVSRGTPSLLSAWSERQPLQITDGSIFWADADAPRPTPGSSVLIAQLTVESGAGFVARAQVQGRSIGVGEPDWTEQNVHWFVA